MVKGEDTGQEAETDTDPIDLARTGKRGSLGIETWTGRNADIEAEVRTGEEAEVKEKNEEGVNDLEGVAHQKDEELDHPRPGITEAVGARVVREDDDLVCFRTY